jgi:hypothetical protein
VHPTLSHSDIERDWRQCWQKPFLELVGEYMLSRVYVCDKVLQAIITAMLRGVSC